MQLDAAITYAQCFTVAMILVMHHLMVSSWHSGLALDLNDEPVFFSEEPTEMQKKVFGRPHMAINVGLY